MGRTTNKRSDKQAPGLCAGHNEDYGSQGALSTPTASFFIVIRLLARVCIAPRALKMKSLSKPIPRP